MGKPAEAMREFDRALQIKPEGYIYLNRAFYRPKADLAGRRQDIEAALQLKPGLVPALAARAELESEAGDHRAAVAAYTAALAKALDDAGLLVHRGVSYARAGDRARADTDFAAATEHAKEAAQLNDLCWVKATAGVALEGALADCDAALAKAPDEPAILDSHGLALLRLGRLDEAMAAYDKALAKAPGQSASLFGRALVWARKGDRAKAMADAAAAAKVDPDVRNQFARFGLTL